MSKNFAGPRLYIQKVQHVWNMPGRCHNVLGNRLNRTGYNTQFDTASFQNWHTILYYDALQVAARGASSRGMAECTHCFSFIDRKERHAAALYSTCGLTIAICDSCFAICDSKAMLSSVLYCSICGSYTCLSLCSTGASSMGVH